MIEPIGQATAAAESVFGDASTWGPVGTGVLSVAGGFEFPSTEEIDSLLSQWKARRDSIAQRGDQLETMVKSLLRAPADDDSTTGYTDTWKQSLMQLRDQHESMVAYIDNYVQKLEAAKTAKQTGEDDNTGALRKSAGGLGQ